MSAETVNVGLLQKMLAGSPSGVDVYATTSGLNMERMAVNGVAHVDLPDGTKVCVLICERIEPTDVHSGEIVRAP
jgi:hypothetical protein